MLYSAQALNCIVTTMVVGEEQALGTYHFAAAETTTQTNNSVLDAAFVSVTSVSETGDRITQELLPNGRVLKITNHTKDTVTELAYDDAAKT